MRDLARHIARFSCDFVVGAIRLHRAIKIRLVFRRGRGEGRQASGSAENAFFVSRYQPMPLIGFLQRFFIASCAGW